MRTFLTCGLCPLGTGRGPGPAKRMSRRDVIPTTARDSWKPARVSHSLARHRAPLSAGVLLSDETEPHSLCSSVICKNSQRSSSLTSSLHKYLVAESSGELSNHEDLATLTEDPATSTSQDARQRPRHSVGGLDLFTQSPSSEVLQEPRKPHSLGGGPGEEWSPFEKGC